MSTSTKTRRRVYAGLTALAVGMLGAVSLTTPAFAANIDPAQKGSIIVHKHENPGNGNQNPGGTGTDPNTPGVADVIFDVCRISHSDPANPINDILAGNNGFWDAVKAISADNGAMSAANAAGVTTLGAYTLTCSAMPATNAQGVTMLEKLDLGAYYVREVSAPAKVTEKARPFIVTLPTPEDHTNFDGEWVYDVNVYPKNTVAETPRKNIVDQDDEDTNGALIGKPITYQVTTKIPALASGQTYNKFILTDVLDAKLDPNTDLSKVVVSVFGGAEFVQGIDYEPVWVGQKLTVTFLAPGLAKLQAGQMVVVEFEASANDIGEIDNQAIVNINDMQIGGNPAGETPTNIVKTRWGGAEFEKVNVNDPSDKLGGAEFNVYMSLEDEGAGCVARPLNELQLVTDGVDGNGDPLPYVVTSASDGKVTIPGLWVGDTELEVAADGTVTNVNEQYHDFDTRCYVLVEVKAPAGFILPSDPNNRTEFIVQTGQVTQANGMGTITNKQQGVPELPNTGGAGQIMMILAGAGALAVAGSLMLLSRKRRGEGVEAR